MLMNPLDDSSLVINFEKAAFWRHNRADSPIDNR